MKELALLSMMTLMILPACSSEQVYATGQNWQRQECAKLPDPQERERCYADADRSYESYKRESDALKGMR